MAATRRLSLRRRKTFEALDAQLAALARQKPVLMIVEDVHWVDPTSLEAFGRSVDRNQKRISGVRSPLRARGEVLGAARSVEYGAALARSGQAGRGPPDRTIPFALRSPNSTHGTDHCRCCNGLLGGP